jgi:hypothetical protein
VFIFTKKSSCKIIKRIIAQMLLLDIKIPGLKEISRGTKKTSTPLKIVASQSQYIFNKLSGYMRGMHSNIHNMPLKHSFFNA